MAPEPEKLDLSALDPARDPHWERTLTRVAERARELRAFRRAVVRRGAVAFVLAAAAAITLWLSAPRREPVHHGHALLDWAVHDVDPGELLGMGANDAQ